MTPGGRCNFHSGQKCFRIQRQLDKEVSLSTAKGDSQAKAEVCFPPLDEDVCELWKMKTRDLT